MSRESIFFFYGQNPPEFEIKRRRIKADDDHVAQGLRVAPDPLNLDDVLAVDHRVQEDGSWKAIKTVRLCNCISTTTRLFSTPSPVPNPGNGPPQPVATIHSGIVPGNVLYEQLYSFLSQGLQQTEVLYAHLGKDVTETVGDGNNQGDILPGWLAVKNPTSLRDVLNFVSRQQRPFYEGHPIGIPILAFRIVDRGPGPPPTQPTSVTVPVDTNPAGNVQQRPVVNNPNTGTNRTQPPRPPPDNRPVDPGGGGLIDLTSLDDQEHTHSAPTVDPPSPPPREIIQPGQEEEPADALARHLRGYDTQDDDQVWQNTQLEENGPSDQHFGGLNAMGTGLGKTIISLAIVAVIRLIEIWKIEITTEGSTYKHGMDGNESENSKRKCKHAQAAIKIQCCCIKGSLAHAIANDIRPGPSMIFTPPGVVIQYWQEARAFLQPEIRFGDKTHKFVTPLYFTSQVRNQDPKYSPQNYKHILVTTTIDIEGGSGHPNNTPESYPQSALNADMKRHYLGPGNKKTVPGQVVQKSKTTFYLWPLPGPTTWRPVYSDQQEVKLKEEHFLVILSNSGNSLAYKTELAKIFKRDYNFPKSTTGYQVHGVWWCVRPRLVCYDEFHKVKSATTIIHNILKIWNHEYCKPGRPEERFKFLAMSATPIITKVDDSLSQVMGYILDKNKDRYKSYKTQATAIDKHFQRLANLTEAQRAAFDGACGEMNKILKSIIVRRTVNSRFHGKRRFNLPPIAVKRWTCKSDMTKMDNKDTDVGKAIWDMVKRSRSWYNEAVNAKIQAYKDKDGYTKEFPDDPVKEEARVRGEAIKAVMKDIEHQTEPQSSGAATSSEGDDEPPADRPGDDDLDPDTDDMEIDTAFDSQHKDPREWLNLSKMNEKLSNTTNKKALKYTLEDYFTEDRNLDINTICRGSGKIELLKKILKRAWRDSSRNSLEPTRPRLKKHVVIFTAAPGEAAIITTFLKRNYADKCRAEWAKDGAVATTLFNSEETLFTDIPFADEETGSAAYTLPKLPTVLPWVEVEEEQARGRIYRCGQRFKSKWFVLLGRDGPFESIISQRHNMRQEMFRQFIDGKDDESDMLPAPSRFTEFDGFEDDEGEDEDGMNDVEPIGERERQQALQRQQALAWQQQHNQTNQEFLPTWQPTRRPGDTTRTKTNSYKFKGPGPAGIRTDVIRRGFGKRRPQPNIDCQPDSEIQLPTYLPTLPTYMQVNPPKNLLNFQERYWRARSPTLLQIITLPTGHPGTASVSQSLHLRQGEQDPLYSMAGYQASSLQKQYLPSYTELHLLSCIDLMKFKIIPPFEVC
ncbi:hypothetical protein V8F33_012982 [Rhypophila sp. PSN 637]